MVGLALCCLIGVAKGQSLVDVWALATGSEPGVVGARLNSDIARARLSQAKGALLPQINFSATSNYNYRDYRVNDPLIPASKDEFNSQNRQFQLTQPLWRRAQWIARQQAAHGLEQTGLQILQAEQDLAAKLLGIWFEGMQARDNAEVAAAQLAAATKQAEITQRGVAAGTHSEPQAFEARAKAMQARTDQSVAQLELDTKLAEIEQLAGPISGFRLPLLDLNKRVAYEAFARL